MRGNSLVVTDFGDGVWAVHHRWQRPVEGTAVYRYGRDASCWYRCERDGAGPCIHILLVRRHLRIHGRGVRRRS